MRHSLGAGGNRNCPGCGTVPRAQRIGEEGVQAHARRLREGDIGQESGEEAADGRGNASGQHHSIEIHARSGQIAGIDEDNVRHGKEGGNTADHFGADVGVVFLELKDLFKQLHGNASLL